MNDLVFTLAQQSTGNAAASAAFGALFLIVWLFVLVLVIAGMWKTFAKAGQPGWAAIIPIFNLYIILKIAGRPGWWLLLLLIPIVNLIVAIIMYHDLAKSFGHGILMTLGLVFLTPVAFCLIGFGGAQYQGPAAA
jgi:uncharacterized membrane protein YhaH (DUF805 family)